MAITLGTNVASISAQRSLADSTRLLSQSSLRLSSGLRINHASDDAAGLAVSSLLDTDARVYTQSVRNANDGISALSIAEGALNELMNITIRQQELAEQAANGVYSFQQRSKLATESNALTDEFNRIVQSTSFNNQDLLRVANLGVQIQLGYGTQVQVGVQFGGGLADAVGTGTFAPSVSYAISGTFGYDVKTDDFNGDGILDIAANNGANLAILLGNGNGTFKGAVNTATGAALSYDLEIGDINNDGVSDIMVPDSNSGSTTGRVLIGNGDGSFKAMNFDHGMQTAYRSYLGDVNGDGKLDIMTVGLPAGTLKVSIALGNGNGTFRAATTVAPGVASTDSMALSDFDRDGKLDYAIGDFNTGTVAVHYGNGNGTFRSPVNLTAGGGSAGRVDYADLNNDGYDDLISHDTSNQKTHVFLNNGNGTFKAETSYAAFTPVSGTATDFNKDGYLDIVSGDGAASAMNVMMNNGDGTFRSNVSFATSGGAGNDASAGDFNGDGVVDVVVSTPGTASVSVFLSNTTLRTTVGLLNLFTVAGARAALPEIADTRTRINQELGAIGSYVSRLTSATSMLQSTILGQQDAKSRILDVDVAEESANQVRAKILQQFGIAVAVQANSMPKIALDLLTKK